jgi:hypothetical protein
MPQGNIVEFLHNEYRDGYLLADPDQFCTVGFLEHLCNFIEAQHGPGCPRCDAVVSDYRRQIENLSKWVRWLLPRRRGGRP